MAEVDTSKIDKTQIGDVVPDFELPTTSAKTIKLSELRGNNVVLFFYPKDNTPVCTKESCHFRDNLGNFKNYNTLVFGVSRDSIASHEKFKAKLELPYELISDEEEVLCQQYDVIKMKSFFGKKIRWIVRSTFLIDKEGILRNEWRKVKVSGHIAEVLDAIKQL